MPSYEGKQEMNKQGTGHLLAILTIFIWGTTFISTKVLLGNLGPIDILFSRFCLGYISLWAIFPHFSAKYGIKAEGLMLFAGFLGTFLYFLMENVALIFTTASNVGILICVAPFFTAVFEKILKPNLKLKSTFFIGLVISIFGVALISFKDWELQFNPMGDGLAIAAALVWALYSVTLKRLSSFEIPTLVATRTIFGYGLLFIASSYLFFGKELSIEVYLQPDVFLNLLFLGVIASAAGYCMWTKAVSLIGAGPTSLYINLTPVICLTCAAIVLHEELTLQSLIGTALVLVGLSISQSTCSGIMRFFRQAKEI